VVVFGEQPIHYNRAGNSLRQPCCTLAAGIAPSGEDMADGVSRVAGSLCKLGLFHLWYPRKPATDVRFIEVRFKFVFIMAKL
jgi:hypothetical protein